MKILLIPPYKQHYYMVSAIIEGLYKNNFEVISSFPGNGAKKVVSDKKFIEYSKDADYIFVFFAKNYGNTRMPKYHLLDIINRPDITVYIDSSEYSYTGHPEKNQIENMRIDPKYRRGKDWINQKMYNYSKYYFKRECYAEDAEMGIIPLLYCAVDKNFGNYDVKKKYDIYYSFRQTRTGLRSEIYDVCNKLKNEGYSVIMDNNVGYKKYLKLIASSYISIDSWGAGDCCARFFEIIANKSCCFCQKYNILFPNNFTNDENYVEYSTIQEFERKIRFYLNNKKKCIDVAEKGYQHLIKYHTSKERVKYLIEKIEERKLRNN